jgi:hypothetical protein
MPIFSTHILPLQNLLLSTASMSFFFFLKYLQGLHDPICLGPMVLIQFLSLACSPGHWLIIALSVH